nr:hypothetical protein GCM10017611_63840 [Rhodococcus wratislaviensis]
MLPETIFFLIFARKGTNRESNRAVREANGPALASDVEQYARFRRSDGVGPDPSSGGRISGIEIGNSM